MTTQKDHQIVVRELRHMSEAEQCRYILAVNSDNEMVVIYINIYDCVLENYGYDYKQRGDYRGWIPMPTYKPGES